MGILAFDIDEKTEVYACDAIKKEKGKYICPDDNCIKRKVPVYLCEKSTGNCFVSYDKALHHPDCGFISAYEAAYHNAVLTNNSLEEIIQAIASGTTNDKNRTISISDSDKRNSRAASLEKHDITISTLYQLYRYCSSNDPQHFICGIPIQDFFISSGTTPIWSKKRQNIDNRMVLAEGYTDQRFADQNRIRIKVKNEPKFMISVVFDNANDFNTICAKIKAYQQKGSNERVPVKICVLGNASSQSYSFPKDGRIIDYKEITITTTPDFIHFLSRKKSSS